MSNEKPKKAFDTIAYTRKVRAELDAKLANMTEEEEDEYWRNMTFEDPVFQEIHESSLDPESADAAVRKRLARSRKVRVDA